MFKDNLVLDTSLLRLNWAVDDVATAIAELMDRLETIEDAETVEKLSALIRALNSYIKVIGESINVEV